MLAQAKSGFSAPPSCHQAASPSSWPSAGHTFCLECLKTALALAAATRLQQCPTCRAKLPRPMPPLSVNTMIKAMLELLLSGEWMSSVSSVSRDCQQHSLPHVGAAWVSVPAPTSLSAPEPQVCKLYATANQCCWLVCAADECRER
jgi:MFS superfamily sulfate permease-like transporter